MLWVTFGLKIWLCDAKTNKKNHRVWHSLNFWMITSHESLLVYLMSPDWHEG